MLEPFVITEEWLQSVVSSLVHLPALSPSTCRATLSHVELQVRLLIQNAQKFQRHSKSSASMLTVSHTNQVLTMNKKENLYGFMPKSFSLQLPPGQRNNTQSAIPLASLLSTQLINPPASTEIHVHWLAIDGSQPQIPDNPIVESTSTNSSSNMVTMDIDNESLSSELKILFQRISSVLLLVPKTNESLKPSSCGFQAKNTSVDRERISSSNSVLNLLRTESSLQSLVPNLCQFFYKQTKNKKQHIYTLHIIVRALEALIGNPTINLQNHLLQIFPALFSCIVTNQLGSRDDFDDHSKDHWSLREYASTVVAFVSWKYRIVFPDLFTKVLKTYTEALSEDKLLTTVYGGLIGLASLLSIPHGQEFICSNEPLVQVIKTLIEQVRNRLDRAISQPLHKGDDYIKIAAQAGYPLTLKASLGYIQRTYTVHSSSQLLAYIEKATTEVKSSLGEDYMTEEDIMLSIMSSSTTTQTVTMTMCSMALITVIGKLVMALSNTIELSSRIVPVIDKKRKLREDETMSLEYASSVLSHFSECYGDQLTPYSSKPSSYDKVSVVILIPFVLKSFG